MQRKYDFKRLAKLAWFYSAPAAVIVATTFFPLRQVAQQAMVGIVLVWVSVGAMSGLLFWE